MGARLVLILALLVASSAWADNVMKCSQQPKLQCASALDFGAKCDGTTDDATALQAAVDSYTSTRGVLVIPAGKRCAVGTALALKANVSIVCEKGGGFKWLSGAAAIIQNTGTSLDDWAVEGCTFDLNSAATTPAFVMGSGTRFVFNDNIVRNPSTSSGTTAYNLVDITCAKGISSSDGSGQIIGNKIFGSNTAARLDTGLRVQPCAQFNLGAGPVIQGNEIKNTGDKGLWLDRGAASFEGTSAVVNGNTITGTKGFGAYLGTSATNFVGNYVYGGSTDAIRVCGESSGGVDDKNCGNNVIANNVILTSGGTTRAINIIAWGTAGNVSGNRLIGNYAPAGIVVDSKGTCTGGSPPTPNKCDANGDCPGGGTCGGYQTVDHETIFGNVVASVANSGIVVENGDDIVISSNTDVSDPATGANPGGIYLKNLDATADTGYTIIGNELGATITSGSYHGITFDEASTGGFSSINITGNTVGSRTRTNGVVTTGIRFINGAVCRECQLSGNNLAGAATGISGWSHAYGALRENLGLVGAKEERRRCHLQTKRASGTGVTGDVVGDGCSPTTTANAAATNSDSDGVYLDLTTSTTNGNAASVTTAESVAERRHMPRMTCAFETGSSITKVRIWVGLFSTSPTGADSVADMAGFRYNPDTDTAGKWSVVTRDGGGSPTAATGVANIAVSTRYVATIDLMDTTTNNVRFYLDQKLVATATATLPTNTVALLPYLSITTTETVAKTIRFGKCLIESQ